MFENIIEVLDSLLFPSTDNTTDKKITLFGIIDINNQMFHKIAKQGKPNSCNFL